MPVPVTTLYAALLGVVAVVLQQLVGRERLRAGVSLGDGGDPRLLAAMRRQANFVEQVPLALLLLGLVELNGAPTGWLHALGALLLASRVVHPLGLRAEAMRVPTRLLGAVGTLLVVVALIGTALVQSIA
jgi:uncharacterized membrane protein YecN with MAPEG domain